MTATSRHAGGPGMDPETILIFAGVGTVAVVGGALAAAVHVGAAIDARGEHIPGNPINLVAGLAKGTVAWPSAATGVLIAIAVAVVVVAVVAMVVIGKVRRRHLRVDRAARRMAKGRELAPLSRRGVAAKAQRLGVNAVGLPIARTVLGDQMLYASWEDCSVDVWGPRSGKTSSRAIPAVLNAPGAVLATSNKRDLVDATRGPRSAKGAVWVFDPQGIVAEDPSWWWNPLTYVTNEVKASMLADVFASAERDPGSRTDAYFEPAAQNLLANLLLAAALAGRPLTQVYLWLTNPTDDEAVQILEENDYAIIAAALQSVINLPEKQRAGVYGTAKEFAAFMTNRQAMRWVTAGREGGRKALNVTEFVAGTGTVYSLSREGKGSAAALVTALTVAIAEGAEDLAKVSPRGRLAVPMVACLDETANVVRWRQIPDLMSHYGSRGICVMVILQSWSQGVDVWGREGMRKLWSAANIKVYGGGVSEVEYLQEISQLIGDFELDTTSRTYNGRGGGSSTSRAVRPERILDVADLTSLPPGRVVVLASGMRPTLAKSTPWMTGPFAEVVQESIDRYDPATPTLITAPISNSVVDVGLP